MGRNVPVDGLADAIMEGLEEYADLATDTMKKAVRHSAKTVKDEIEAHAPKDRSFCQSLSDCPSAGTRSCQAWRWSGCRKATYRRCRRKRHL